MLFQSPYFNFAYGVDERESEDEKCAMAQMCAGTKVCHGTLFCKELLMNSDLELYEIKMLQFSD